MFRKNENKPLPHKHAKKIGTKPSLKEPALSQRISEKLSMTEDIIAKAPIVTCYGNRRVCIENYRNIIEYTSESVKVQSKTCKIHITGQKLVIAYFRDDGMCVIGNIEKVGYY